MSDDLELVIGIEKIRARVREVAVEIDARLSRDAVGSVEIVWIREGAAPFVNDLLQSLKIPREVRSIKTRLFGEDNKRKAAVELVGDAPEVRNRDVILIDDILDTGTTAEFAVNLLESRGARKIYTCFFLDKKIGARKPVVPDFKCFDVENFYVVGYGLDDNGSRRELQGIYKKL